MADSTIRLDLYESRVVVPIQLFAAGTYTFRQSPAGNSVLSTLWVKTVSGGATVTVNVWEPGPSGGETPGQRIDLGSHAVISTSDTSDRTLFTRIHDKIFIEVVVAGGSAELGVYMTTVSDFPSEAPFLDGQLADLTNDKGNANVIYDPSDGKFYLVRGTAGIPDVNIVGGTINVTPTDEGTPYFKRGNINASPGATVSVFTDSVPLLTTRKLRQLFVTAYNDGQFSLEVNGVEVAAGLISSVEHNVKFKFDPPRPISAGATIELKYTADSEPNYPCPITAFLSGNDIT